MEKVKKSKFEGFNGFLLGLSVAGLATVAFGTLIESKVISVLIVSIGGTLFGTCFSSAISRLSGDQAIVQMQESIKSIINSKFVSSEEQLKEFRKVWYHYRVTIIDHKLVWRHTRYDFQNSNEVGSLSTSLSIEGKYGQKISYKVEAGLRENRFIMFVKPNAGTEPPGVQLFPFMGSEFHSVHCGIGLFQTWDGLHTIQPIIMSPFPIIY